MTIEQKYQELLKTPSDCNEHFPLIRSAVEKGDKVVELGVRNIVSSWALLANRPSVLVSVDIVQPPHENLREITEAADAAGIQYRFIKQDSTHLVLSPFDVLFVDTLHLYSHIVKELWRHSEQVNKRIIFHDCNIPEVRACIQDFLFNPHWKWKEETAAGTGCCVIERMSRPV